MAKQKTIPLLEAEKAENERKLSQLQHKKQQIENRITYYEKGDRRNSDLTNQYKKLPFTFEQVSGIFLRSLN